MIQKKIDLIKKSKEFQRRLDAALVQIANDAVKEFVGNFNRQGSDNQYGQFQRWRPRKGEIRGGIARVSRRSAGARGVLIQSGDLKRSIHIKRIGRSYAVVGTSDSIEYAAIHNYGLHGLAFGKHPFKMPQRKFIGRSRQLNLLTLRRINRAFRQTFR